MTLIVEDGTLVANANSYVDLAAIKSYATKRGVTLPADATIEVYSQKAMDYLESKRDRYKGLKITKTQALQWPRYPVIIDGFELGSDEIPSEIKSAQCQLILEVNSGVDLQPTMTGSLVKREKIGPIETEFAVSESGSLAPDLPKVDSLLSPLYSTSSFGYLTVGRI